MHCMCLPSVTHCILTDIFLLRLKKSELIHTYERCMVIFKSLSHLVLYTIAESQPPLIDPLVLDISDNSAEVLILSALRMAAFGLPIS